MAGSPLTRDVSSTCGRRHLTWLPACAPLHLQIRNLSENAHSALSVVRAANYAPPELKFQMCLGAQAQSSRRSTSSKRTLPVATRRLPPLHSGLVMPSDAFARSTADAGRVPVFLAAGPHFTGCPVPYSLDWTNVKLVDVFVASAHSVSFCYVQNLN